MANPITFDVESYFGEFANASALAEAAKMNTIPTGSYQLQVTKREGRYFELKDSKNGGKYWSGVFSDTTDINPEWRKGVKLTAAVFNSEGRKVSTTQIEASWEDKRDEKGKLDRLFNRWGQLSKAVFPTLKDEERGQKAIGEVLQALDQYPVKAFITESFQVPAIDGTSKWQTANTEEEAKTYREAGYKASNFVVSITKV